MCSETAAHCNHCEVHHWVCHSQSFALFFLTVYVFSWADISLFTLLCDAISSVRAQMWNISQLQLQLLRCLLRNDDALIFDRFKQTCLSCLKKKMCYCDNSVLSETLIIDSLNSVWHAIVSSQYSLSQHCLSFCSKNLSVSAIKVSCCQL